MRRFGIGFLVVIFASVTAAGTDLDRSKKDPELNNYTRMLTDLIYANPNKARIDAVTRKYYTMVTVGLKIESATENPSNRVDEYLVRQIKAWCLLSLALEMANSDMLSWSMPMYERPIIKGICGVPKD